MQAPSGSKRWVWLPVLAVAAVSVVFMANKPPRPAERDDRGTLKRAIQACWKEQARKSHAPEVARFVAGACEKMEDDFRAEYGTDP